MSEYQTFRCDCMGRKLKGRGKKIRHTHKRVSDEILYDLVRAEILYRRQTNKKMVTAEEIAKKCQVKVHRIKKIFAKLNQQGILSQAHHEPPVDCRRHRLMSLGGENSWCASTYDIINKGN